MSLIKNAATGNWEADFRSNAVGRLHVSLRTKRKAEAMDRHSALAQLIREHPIELLEDLRNGRVTVEAITQAHLEKRPFASLMASQRALTICEAAEIHLAHIKDQTDMAANTRRARERALLWAADYFGESRRLDTITPDEIGSWKAHLLANGVAGAPVKPWSAAQYLIHFGALFNQLIRREERAALRERRAPRLLHNPVEAELVPLRPESQSRALSKEEAQRLLAATPAQFRFFVGLGLFTGLRIGETRMLRPPPHDVDLANGLIIVQPREGWKPKSGKRREIPIAPEFLPIVTHHAEKLADERWMMPAMGDRRSLRHAKQMPVARDTLEDNFRRIVERAGLPYGKKDPMGITFHTLRHTFASWLVMAGVDLFTVAKLMGHADTTLIESTYGHLSPNHIQAAVASLGSGLGLSLDGESQKAPEITEFATSTTLTEK